MNWNDIVMMNNGENGKSWKNMVHNNVPIDRHRLNVPIDLVHYPMISGE